MWGIFVLAILGLAAISIFASLQARRYLTEREEAKRVRSLFSRYVPEIVVDALLERKDAALFEGREYYATVLSCAIWKFGLFAEDLSPQQTLQYLNEFYTLAGKAVEKHRGMLESLRGDSITAVFGVLIDEPFQEERAIRAALDIVRLVSAMNARWQAQGRKPFQVGIGLNSGTIIAGDIGYAQRREFSLVGNDVQVARRLQEATEEMNASVIASASTFRPVNQLFVGIPIKSIPLRDLKKLQQAFIVRGLSKRTAEEGDTLTFPTPSQFRTTQIKTDPPPVLYEPVPEIAPVSASPPTPPSPPRIDPSTLPTIRRGGGFSTLDDDRPAMPEPPHTDQTYEDDTGPPLRLGP
ncbi:MAG: adenylate/guanylate cyclase domain-containing protein [Candidatus Eremiobacteraeota bacterium]|nr:adenylate/guanylate cyclase domain-containing protein [Candidatus Eremiobacteraeota bacterium]